jgi:predicted component of viral defense system (DUF524 family)
MEALKSISINLNHLEEGLTLFIDERKKNTLFEVEDAFENNEAIHQLIEGCFYDYEFSNPDYYFEKDLVVQPHSRNKYIGTISPNIFVGTLSLPIHKNGNEINSIDLEVQSIKTDYRNDYRNMLELITEKCTDLLMQANSPVSHSFETDFSEDNKTLYQKFAFINSIISTPEFSESIHRIVSSPVTKWQESSELRDVRKVRKFKNSNVKELVKGTNRISLSDGHYLNTYGLVSIPSHISATRKIDSVDTPENRFIKHALEVFLKFCLDINNVAKAESKLEKESNQLIKTLESHLHHSVFKEISRPATLKINSPILQRKEGYRDVLRVWLMFDLAAKLIWKGGEDIYKGGKKDIAVLYEYWLFFKLLDLFKSIFNIEPNDISDLIKETSDGLNLQLKQGNHTALKGIYNTGTRKLNIRFNYNRSFRKTDTYPASGSWTTTMRPDYTLSFWPKGISETEAETEELIVHIHFDAKYKIANLGDILNQEKEEDLDSEKQENRNGIYKNADLLKMHAYKDAIRRTGGAYVLYPGDKPLNKIGFHEILPGLGAFPVKPSKTDSGISELKNFIFQVIEHFVNRASQREKLAYSVYDIHKHNKPNELNEPIPEAYGENRGLIPDNTYVLIGYYSSKQQHDWIKSNKLYNFRMGSGNGSLILDKETVSSKYLLLHTAGDSTAYDIWKIVSIGPKVYSKQDLIKKGYDNPSQDNYLVVALEKLDVEDFKDCKWKFKELANYSTGRASAFPFTSSLTELMKSIEK